MKPFGKTVLLSAAFISIPALAEEQGFDNFLLNSPSIVAPSQYYQVKGGRFEALVSLTNGSIDSKGAQSVSADVKGQNLATGYAQALSNQLVLGADVDFADRKIEVEGTTIENSSTEIKPTVAFSLSPIFSLGASINLRSGKTEAAGQSDSYSSNTFSVGGTLHQELWEASVGLTTKNKDEKKAGANRPQELALHGRYRVLPVLALGFRVNQADYPGIEAANNPLETESQYSVILESAFSEQFSVEVAFTSFANEAGQDGLDSTRIHLAGAYDIASNMELGGQVQLHTSESDASETSLNTYALTFTGRY